MLIVKLPSAPDVTPTDVPFTTIDAPAIGSSLPAYNTLPEIERDWLCANPMPAIIKQAVKNKNFLINLTYLKLLLKNP
jgi:hypothetical protein